MSFQSSHLRQPFFAYPGNSLALALVSPWTRTHCYSCSAVVDRTRLTRRVPAHVVDTDSRETVHPAYLAELAVQYRVWWVLVVVEEALR